MFMVNLATNQATSLLLYTRVMNTYQNVDEYMSGSPTYALPADNVVHFGGHPRHIGFYPGPIRKRV